MSDYTKTVKQLRYCSKATVKDCMECEGYRETGDCVSEKLAKEAATAIEELTAQVRDNDYLIQRQVEEIERLRRDVKKQQEKMLELAKRLPHWASVDERKPPEYTDVWCAVYTTDLIYVEDGETAEEAIENRQREAARNPRVTLGSYSEDEGWTDGYFGMPMVCRPDYWLEMTIPEPPQEGTHENRDNP